MKNKYSEELKKGLSKKQIAKGLRQILYPDMDDADVENISICLLCHLLIENRINGILYRWLKYDLPFSDKMNEKKIKDELLGKIINMNFATKYSIIYPSFSAWFKKDSETVWKINDLRNDIFHGRALKDAKFEKKSINAKGIISKLFISAQEVVMRLDKFEGLLDDRRAICEKWERRLKKLGQPLL